MPRGPQTVPANGAVLRWARDTSAYSLREAAERLGLAEDELAKIEEGQKAPSSVVFQKMISLYRRVESVLLLPYPPEPEQLPQDFRTAGPSRKRLSPETRSAIRDAKRIQLWISELRDEDPELIAYPNIRQATGDHEAEALAQAERARFGVTVDMQRRWRPGDDSFNRWRLLAQRQGILVILKKMPWADCRGLSLWSPELVPTIVVNTEDYPNARIFTLFHEYAHLMLSESGICLAEQMPATPKGLIEDWSNSFAAEFLVPKHDLRRIVDARFADLGRDDWTIEDIRKLAATFRVSRYVVARRLKELHISSFYDHHADELRLYDKKPQRETPGAQRPSGWQVTQKLAEVGFAAATAVLDALHSQVVDTTEAAHILGLHVDQLRELEERVEVQRSRDPRA